MAWHPATFARVLATVLVPVALGACGGGKKKVEEPKDEEPQLKQPVQAPETEEDREKKRHAEAIAIIPEGSTCLPPELRSPTAPRLELAAIGAEAVVCAIDQDRTRLLGAVGCWSVDVHSGELKYQPPTSLPGRGFAVQLDDRCARGFCLPKDAKVPADPVAFISWNLDNSKVAVLAGDNVHIFDAASKAHESTFSIRGDKGVTSEPTAINWAGDKNGGGEALFVEASDGSASPVFVFKPDGTPVGPIEAIGGAPGKPTLLSTKNGSFMLLDPKRVAISEQGFSTVTTYDIDTGKRAKIVRKLPAGPCKKDELDASWRDPGAQVAPKCKEYISKTFAPLVGADAVAGSKNFLVLLRGPRLGELAGVDAKTLSEKKTIKMPWCDAAGGAPAAGGEKQ
jgi:hypothetical protein